MTLSHGVTTRLLRAADGLSSLHDAPDLFVRHSGRSGECAQGRTARIREMEGSRQFRAVLQHSLGEQPDTEDEHFALPVTLTSRTLVGGAGSHARDSESARGLPPAASRHRM